MLLDPLRADPRMTYMYVFILYRTIDQHILIAVLESVLHRKNSHWRSGSERTNQ
jgi:hypothetical protein